MSRTRVHSFSISLDGFATGEGQSLESPFGHAGHRLHVWMFATRYGHTMQGKDGGGGGVDDAFAQRFLPGIGAEIMGAGKFGPPGWQDDPEWTGWWGPNPPFHTPTFVLTHRPRPSIEMEGGTTFHFLDASPAEALEQARKAADGQDVRIGGGPTVVRDFLAAGLIDHLHVSDRPDRARPGRSTVGRAGRPGRRLRGRSHVLAQRRHPRDVQPPVDAKHIEMPVP